MKIMVNIPFYLLLLILTLSSLSGLIPPSDSIIVALSGLGFPVLWISSALILSVMLFFRRRIPVLIGSIVLIVTMPILLRYLSVDLKDHRPAIAYKLFDFNTYGLRIPDSVSRQLDCQDTINTFLNSEKYTIACFQEYPMKGARHGKFYEKLMNGLQIRYKALSDYNYEEKSTQYILVTASEFPVLRQQTFKSEGSPFAMYTDIQFPDTIIRVYNIHLKSVKLTSEKRLLVYDRKLNLHDFLNQTTEALRKLKIAFILREEQVKTLKSSIRESPYPIIIAGDFNDTPVSYAYNQLHAGKKDASFFAVNGFKRTYKQSTFPLQIDYILHDKLIRSSGYKRIELNISDHYAISTVFTTEE